MGTNNSLQSTVYIKHSNTGVDNAESLRDNAYVPNWNISYIVKTWRRYGRARPDVSER